MIPELAPWVIREHSVERNFLGVAFPVTYISVPEQGCISLGKDQKRNKQPEACVGLSMEGLACYDQLYV